MRLAIGTTNKSKISALEEIIKEYDFLKDAQVISADVKSDVAEQPKTLEETLRGAMSRARNAFQNCYLSFGVESGLMPVPYTKTNYMDVCCCAIYDGKEFHLGLSSAFEYPKEIMWLVLEEGLDVSKAGHKMGLTKNPEIGSHEGVIGILTKGRLVRKEYTKQAIRTALIHLENRHLF